jgi:mono/diheme cytochrome c family protein
VNLRALLLALALAGSVCFVLTAQQPAQPRVFTSAQAEAGRVAYENACGKCHTYRLLGRKGEAGELPPLDTLSADYRKFISGASNPVPPLAGKVFLSRWGNRTAAQLIERFQETASDPFFKFENMTDEAVVNITAYALQVSGAKPGPQPLTRTTDVVVNSLIP